MDKTITENIIKVLNGNKKPITHLPRGFCFKKERSEVFSKLIKKLEAKQKEKK